MMLLFYVPTIDLFAVPPVDDEENCLFECLRCVPFYCVAVKYHVCLFYIEFESGEWGIRSLWLL